MNGFGYDWHCLSHPSNLSFFRMPQPDDIPKILDRIAKGEQTEADLSVLKDLLNRSDTPLGAALSHRVSSVQQQGKYSVNIQQGEGIQIGDRTYVDINDEAVRAIAQAIRAEAQEPKSSGKEAVNIALSTQERMELSETLYALLPQQFNMLLFTLNPPAGVVPPMSAPGGDRASALLNWAEAPGGCGLRGLKQTLDHVLSRL